MLRCGIGEEEGEEVPMSPEALRSSQMGKLAPNDCKIID